MMKLPSLNFLVGNPIWLDLFFEIKILMLFFIIISIGHQIRFHEIH